MRSLNFLLKRVDPIICLRGSVRFRVMDSKGGWHEFRNNNTLAWDRWCDRGFFPNAERRCGGYTLREALDAFYKDALERL